MALTSELKTIRNIFLAEDPKALLDLCLEEDPETKLFPVRLHDEAGNELAETSFPTKDEGDKFVDFLMGEAVLRDIKTLADKANVVQWDGICYTILIKDFSPGEFPDTNEDPVLKACRPQGGQITIHRSELPKLKVEKNTVSFPGDSNLAPLEFFKLIPAHL